MFTSGDITAIMAECMSIQMVDVPIEYDTEIALDSFGFVWFQHLLEERCGFDLEQPGRDVMDTFNSPRAIHRHLAHISPDTFAAVDDDGPES